MEFQICRRHNLLGFVLPLIALTGTLSTAQVNATTWQYNNWRTGQNTSETTLTTTNVTENRFEHIVDFHWSLDGTQRGLIRGHTDSDVILIHDSQP